LVHTIKLTSTVRCILQVNTRVWVGRIDGKISIIDSKVEENKTRNKNKQI